MTVAVLTVLMCRSAAAQRSNIRVVRDRLANTTTMSAQEIADVLQASRESLGFRTFRFSFSPTGDEGPEVLMAPDGRPIFVRMTSMSISMWSSIPSIEPQQPQQPEAKHVELVTLTNYTRHAPEYCDGSFAPGELVIDYERRDDEWTVSARQSRPASEPFAPIFAAISGEVALEDAGRSVAAGRQARAFGAA